MEEIEQVKHFIHDTSPEGEELARGLLHLACLYFQEGHALRLDGLRKYQAAVAACGGCTLQEAEYTAAAGAWLEKSVKLNRQILQLYPQFSAADEVELFLGRALIDLGRSDEAYAELFRVVRVYPDSKWVPDAYLALGEYWFDRQDARNAMNAYQRVLAYDGFDGLEFARYKLALCYEVFGEYVGAIMKMKEVVEATTHDGSTVLHTEAAKELARLIREYSEP